MPDTTVQGHPRKGTKGVKRHLRRIKKDYDRSVNPVREKLEIIELDEIGVIELPSEIFNQIKAGVTPPLQGLKQAGFSDLHLQELFELNGISDKGEAIIRNSTTGAMEKIQVINLTPPNIQTQAML
jgi:hypothetical protein